MNRESRVKEVLNRLMNDKAATDAEKLAAKAALERLKNPRIKAKHSSKINWDHGDWRTSRQNTYGVMNMTGCMANGTAKVHVKFGGNNVNLCTDKQFEFICNICEQRDWEPPITKPSFNSASEWLSYYVRRW